MRMIGATISLVTSIAYTKIQANLTSPSLTSFDIMIAHIAGGHKRRRRRIMKVVQHHHRRMFSPPKSVVLIMVPLAKTQESLSGVKKFAFYDLIFIFRVGDHISDFNLLQLFDSSEQR